MTINLTDLKALAEAATPGEWHADEEAALFARPSGKWVASVGEVSFSPEAQADAAYIAAASPAAMLPLINALIEWREAYQAWINTDPHKMTGKIGDRLDIAEAALLALIRKQETNNDAS